MAHVLRSFSSLLQACHYIFQPQLTLCQWLPIPHQCVIQLSSWVFNINWLISTTTYAGIPWTCSLACSSATLSYLQVGLFVGRCTSYGFHWLAHWLVHWLVNHWHAAIQGTPHSDKVATCKDSRSCIHALPLPCKNNVFRLNPGACILLCWPFCFVLVGYSIWVLLATCIIGSDTFCSHAEGIYSHPTHMSAHTVFSIWAHSHGIHL